MASGCFDRCIVGGEECPPYCKKMKNVDDSIITALGYEEIPQITDSTVAEVMVPGREVAPKGARMFSKIWGFGMRVALRFATGNLSSELLRLHKKARIEERQHLMLFINGTLKRLPVVDAYCLLTIALLAKTDAPWDTSCREARAPAMIASQKKLHQLALEAMNVITNVNEVEYPKYQQTCEDYPTLDDMWQIYDGIAYFFEGLMGLIVRFEANERLDSEPTTCARCRKMLTGDLSYDILVRINSNVEFGRRFTFCDTCRIKFVGLTRVTKRQKRPRDDSDEPGQSRPRVYKKQKNSAATRLSNLNYRIEVLRLLLEHHGGQ